MPLKTCFHRLLEQADGVRLSLATRVRRLSPSEWTWSPEDGIASAQDIVMALMADEQRRAAQLVPASEVVADAADALGTPESAAETLRRARARVKAALDRSWGDDSRPEAVRTHFHHVLCMVESDARACGAIDLLQALIDPTRAAFGRPVA